MKREMRLFSAGAILGVVIAVLLATSNAKAVSSILAVVTCSSTAACTGGSNASTGPGVQGTSARGKGVIGTTTFNSTTATNGEAGVLGQDLETSGAFGYGVRGVSALGVGVRGDSTSNVGVVGGSVSQIGVSGYSRNFIGVVASSTNGIGMQATGRSEGLVASARQYGVLALGDDYGIRANGSAAGFVAFADGGAGADLAGRSYGLVARSDNTPLLATDTRGTDLFYVDGNGNVFYSGSLNHFSRTSGLVTATAYTQATSPAVEETGTARLVFGQANVYLSPALARAVDPRRGYQVFLTPNADTRGLYVAS